MKRPKVTKLHGPLLSMTLLPILILGLVITVFSTDRFAASMHHEVQNGLAELSNSLLVMLEHDYPGAYRMEEKDGAIWFYKGDHLLNEDYDLIDAVKEATGVDVTILYQDVRVATTLKNDQGQRLIGTKVNVVVSRDVLETGNGKFYSSVSIADQKYFAYYAPLFGEDGSCIGMIFVAKPSETVDRLIKGSIMPIVVIAVLAMILVAMITSRYTTGLVNTIKKMETYLANISKGCLHEELDYSVLKRDDELGEMGRNAVRMQKALRELVEQDILTGLDNRRCGEKKLLETHQELLKKGVGYCVAIGDIDFFKKVNDTYGHACGDVVLVEIANCMRHFMRGKGYAIRWGGEEFLLVFPQQHREEVAQLLNEFIRKIERDRISYQEYTDIHVTMTFGVAQGNAESDNTDSVVLEADSRLYYGKQHGRNQVVADTQEEQDL